MIPNQWYPLLEAHRVKRKPIGVRRLGERLVLWRGADGALVCMTDRCPHRGVALSRGRVRDGTLECGYHGFRFRPDGACVLMPCEGPDARIPAGIRATPRTVREAYGLIWLYWGEPCERLPEIPWFPEFGERRRGTCSTSFDWPQNYSRTLETNFDIHHTPWLHGSIVPTGARVDPFEVETKDDQIRCRGVLRREGRTRGMPFRIEFRAPSVTLIELTPKLRLISADCPIDDQNTWRFARYYSDYLPGFDRVISWLGIWLELRIVQSRQDLPMVATQEPRLPDQHRDPLVHADAGIAAYLKLRRRLLAG